MYTKPELFTVIDKQQLKQNKPEERSELETIATGKANKPQSKVVTELTNKESNHKSSKSKIFDSKFMDLSFLSDERRVCLVFPSILYIKMDFEQRL